jgi:Rieske Fe-S protein
MNDGTTRREFVAGGVVTAGLMVIGCAKTPKTTAAPSDGKVTLSLADHPSLAQPGGFVGVDVDGLDGPVIVFKDKDGNFGACSQKCTHLGCKVKYDIDEALIACPCHGSRFNVDGSVAKGPAKDPLKKYAVEGTSDAVIVTVA